MTLPPVRVVLGVTGCIAAYKAAEIVRALTQAGAEVRVVMTRHATEFLAPLTELGYRDAQAREDELVAFFQD